MKTTVYIEKTMTHRYKLTFDSDITNAEQILDSSFQQYDTINEIEQKLSPFYTGIPLLEDDDSVEEPYIRINKISFDRG